MRVPSGADREGGAILSSSPPAPPYAATEGRPSQQVAAATAGGDAPWVRLPRDEDAARRRPRTGCAVPPEIRIEDAFFVGEIQAIEGAGRSCFDFETGDGGEPVPVAMKLDMSRQRWDETRHVEISIKLSGHTGTELGELARRF